MSPNPDDAADPPSADDFGHNVINSIFDTFVVPELERRHLALERDDIRKVVVELDPDRPHPQVQINDQAKIVAHVQATRQIGAGEEVAEADFDDILAVAPQDVGPNSGYVCFAVIKGKQYLRFDFRYNKKRVVGLLDRAREFLETARDCYAVRPAVACDLAFSAAELSVQAQMLLMQQRTKSHIQRRDWLVSWAEHENAPAEHAAALRRLHENRAAGRYADAPFVIDQQELSALLDVVESMIETAIARSGRDA